MVCLSAMLGISPMVCIWGVPHVPVSVLLRSGEQNPLTLPLFGRMPEPQFSFFTFHFLIFIFYSILHDTKHQLERHGILQTTH